MHLFLSIIIIMATPCLEDIEPKSSPKKWLIVFAPSYLQDSLERIWDTQCITLFHPKKQSDPAELQGSVSPQPHTSPCTSWEPLQLCSRENTSEFQVRLPGFLSIITKAEVSEHYKTSQMNCGSEQHLLHSSGKFCINFLHGSPSCTLSSIVTEKQD